MKKIFIFILLSVVVISGFSQISDAIFGVEKKQNKNEIKISENRQKENTGIKSHIKNSKGDIYMGDYTYTQTCSDNFYDSGGPSGDFQNGEAFTMTVEPTTPGTKMKVEFTYFDCGTQGEGWDYLMIYDGESVTDPLIVSSDNVGNDGMLDVFTATNFSGALTFYFQSSSYVPNPGWEGVFSCAPLSGTDLALESILPSENSPSFIKLGNDGSPKVTISNSGGSDESTYDVQLIIEDQNKAVVYDETVSDFGTIQSGSELTVDFPTWTSPAEGTYSMTATVTLIGDENPNNDIAYQSCTVKDAIAAYAWCGYEASGDVSKGPIHLLIPDGDLLDIKDISNIFMTSGDMVGDQWYGVVYGNGSLFSIDKITGDITEIGGGVDWATSFAYDAKNDIAYTLDTDGSLYSIDITDGSTSLIGVSGKYYIGAACDYYGNIYAVALNDNLDASLFSINPLTGEASLIGNLGLQLNYAQDIAYDRDNDILYGALYTDSKNAGGLYTIDINTGNATLLYEFQDEVTGFAIPYHERYTVTFNVDDGSEPIEGAEIEINDKTLTTNVNGVATTDLINGTYSYTVSYQFCDDYNGDVTVSGTGETVDISMNCSDVYSVTFHINDEQNEPIAGANITVPMLDVDRYSNIDGELILEDVPTGTYSYTVSANGYSPVNDNFEVIDQDIDVNVILFTNLSDYNSNILIYPNPNSGIFKIVTDKKYEIEISDITGKIIFTKTLKKSENEINLSENAKGIYFIKLYSKTKAHYHKIILE